MQFISYQKHDGEVIADSGEDRIGFPISEFENWLEEGNCLYHGMADPDEFETPTGRWSIESYWEFAPEEMILRHLNEFANVYADYYID